MSGMPQSLSAVYVHIVFSTKERRRYIKTPELQIELHAYLGGISNHLGCAPLIVGGVEDHVHILARQSRTITLADRVRDLKSGSSTWIKERNPGLLQFAWQGGYGAFSVDSAGVEQVRAYIRNQEEHHHAWSFQDEFRKLLKEHDLAWNEKYVWD